MNKKYLPSALILYLNYFIHGVGCSILGQAVIKDALAGAWGVESMAITAISAALGLGRLIALPFALLNLHFPSFVNKAIGSVANTATPLALISIGASFEGKKALKKMKPTLLASFIKLILLAGLFLPLAVFFGYRNTGEGSFGLGYQIIPIFSEGLDERRIRLLHDFVQTGIQHIGYHGRHVVDRQITYISFLVVRKSLMLVEDVNDGHLLFLVFRNGNQRLLVIRYREISAFGCVGRHLYR